MNYYCLIAGLPDLQLEDTKNASTMSELKNELLEQLSYADAQLLKLLFAKFDNQNWLKFFENKDAILNPLGNLNTDDLEQLTVMMQEVENPKDSRLMSFIPKFYSSYNDDNFFAEGITHEDYLSGLYYENAMQNDNLFLKTWFEFNLNINNILTAVSCRKHGLNQKTLVVGNNEVAQTLRTSNARDFSLTGIVEQLEVILRISEESDMLEREKKIDTLKWNWLEENTFFNYFSIEKILAYVLKTEMINRWKPLNVEKGTQIFRELLTGMKEEVKFETTNL